MKKWLVVFVLLSIVLGISVSPAPVQAGNWSTGMFTINKCSWAGQQHCRWAATELTFYPDPGCSYITFKGNRVNGMVLTMDVPSSKSGHRTYGWGISTFFANTNSGWQNSSNWRYYNTCR